MDFNTNSKMYGVHEGIAYGQYDRLDQLNNRIYDRFNNNNINDIKYDIRSVPTRNCLLFPIVDMKYNAKTKIKHSLQKNNIDIVTESQLRNQFYALQHGADQSIYVPSSTSDLYKVTVPITRNQEKQPHQGLFEKNTFVTTENLFIKNSPIGKNTFNNCTKTQLRNLN